jgi:hypothetical protein
MVTLLHVCGWLCNVKYVSVGGIKFDLIADTNIRLI